jgi:hypothetical protein
MTPEQISKAKYLIASIAELNVDTVISEDDADLIYEVNEETIEFLKELIK